MAIKRGGFISKSAYIAGLQCIKALYFYKNYYQFRDPLSPELQVRFKQGHDFGKLAWELFPNGIDCSPASNYPSDIKKAENKVKEILTNQEKAVIYEATFSSTDFLSILDILVIENNQLIAYEVKSSVELSETYFNDAAFQYYVMNLANFKPDKFYLVHLASKTDFDHITIEDIICTDVTKEIVDLQDYIAENANKMTKAKNDIGTLKEITHGNHCEHPYKCNFTKICELTEKIISL